MSMPVARVIRGAPAVAVADRDLGRPRRRLRIVVLVLLALIGLPLVAVVLQIAHESSALMSKPRDSQPAELDPVVMLEGTALANQLGAELGTTDITLARFVAAVSPVKLATVAPGDQPCGLEELAEAGLSLPTSERDGVSYRVRVSAPGEQIDPGSLADVAVEGDHAIATFREDPTAWNLRKLRAIASKLHTIVFVVAVRTSATLEAENDRSFEPGTLRGTAYVYSARSHRIRCAGPIDLKNRDTVRFTYRRDAFADSERRESAERALVQDLDDQLLMAVESSLHAVATD